MTKTFSTINEITDTIMEAIIDRVPGARAGVSSRSVSRYVRVEDSDGVEHKIRISDHSATASCQGTIVSEFLIADLALREIDDECGEFDHVETDQWWQAEDFIESASAALRAIEQVRDE